MDLTWHAYLTKDEFDKLITKYTEQAEEIYSYSIIEDDYVLVPYTKFGLAPYANDLTRYLEAHEVCYGNTPSVSIEGFTRVFCKRWERYASKITLEDEINIFESAYFQHSIHDLMRLYAPENTIIIEHLKRLIREVEELNQCYSTLRKLMSKKLFYRRGRTGLHRIKTH
ncbi:MAG TPA: hypothetical protein PKA28_02980 [Methylomusa anaerophila]|uniref:Uncharacterized protein n=1 Tax=Methylomusa anaerophila TaxID=1930071 RepID=A0A348ANW2_9FIRM|nr:hypothetical protein [Methylomusa anaerophila]BBB92760.1 hypothetical protein MAMMFC1_03456 [Methylomusa anaerophila]HML87389.1 hypothetical protein [Methylomusa anaerophila]